MGSEAHCFQLSRSLTKDGRRYSNFCSSGALWILNLAPVSLERLSPDQDDNRLDFRVLLANR